MNELCAFVGVKFLPQEGPTQLVSVYFLFGKSRARENIFMQAVVSRAALLSEQGFSCKLGVLVKSRRTEPPSLCDADDRAQVAQSSGPVQAPSKPLGAFLHDF